MNNKNLKIATNEAVNKLMEEQEECLEELIEHIKKPFEDKWEYMEWHRKAIALELSQTDKNDIFLSNKAMWSYLIGEEEISGIREWIIFILHNFLEEKFSKARIELLNREAGGEE